MSHRAAIYLVRVRKKNDSIYRLFGDYDGAGTWFGDVVEGVLQRLNDPSRDRKVVARFEAPLNGLDTDQVGTSILSGRSGVTSVLERPGDQLFERSPEHAEYVRSGVLFVLPRGHKEGRLAVHVPHGRSCKGIVEGALRKRASELGFVVELGAIVPSNALRDAVDRDAIERVTLIKRDPARADRFAEAAMWGADEVERLELSFPSRRKRRLRRDPLKRFLDDPTPENRRQIIEFGGLQFDEAAVTVELPDGAQRTFYLEPREGGHPMTMAITVGAGDRYGALADDIARGLRDVARHP